MASVEVLWWGAPKLGMNRAQAARNINMCLERVGTVDTMYIPIA